MNDKYKGMTVNERLFVGGLMEEFDNAVKEKNIEKIVSILEQVDITSDSLIMPILKQLGL